MILLRDGEGFVDGFSTLMRMHVGGATVFFSGDTIVARHRWGSYDLPRLWGRHVFATASGNPYWLLISSGFRTYRYLPLFFRDFYPRFDADAPLKPLLDRVAVTPPSTLRRSISRCARAITTTSPARLGQLGQLGQLRLMRVRNAAETYLRKKATTQTLGDIKIPALDGEQGWGAVFAQRE